MSGVRIFTTGIRSGEYITSAPGAKQNAGTVMQIRGHYPPSQKALQALDVTTLRDAFNQYAFFAPMDFEARRQWLTDQATSNPDLYMEDVPLEVRFVNISGEFFTKSLSQAQVDTLLRGNPHDPEGYWPIRHVYNLFPRKPGSRAAKHTLIFRPNNWILMPSQNVVSSFTGLFLDLNDCMLHQGTLATANDTTVYTFKTETDKVRVIGSTSPSLSEYAVRSPKGRSLSWEYLTSLLPEHAEIMNKVRSILTWFPPALHKSLIQKLIRTRCKNVSHATQVYPAGAVLLTSLCMLLLHPGAFVPNIQRFVTGLESSFKRLAVSICEDSFVEEYKYITMLFACAKLAQEDRNWMPSEKVLRDTFRVAILAQSDCRMFYYDWHSFSELNRSWDIYTFSYLLLKELKSFESDIKMIGSIANHTGGYSSLVLDTELFPTMPLVHCVDQHTFTEIAHYLPYSGGSYGEEFKRIWNLKTGVNPRNQKYSGWQDTAEDISQAQELLWLAKTHKPTLRGEASQSLIVRPPSTGVIKPIIVRPPSTGVPRPITPIRPVHPEIDFTYTLDSSWLAGMLGPIEVNLGRSAAIVVMRTDDIYEFTAIKRPSRDKDTPELTDDEKALAIHSVKYHLHQGMSLANVPGSLKQFQGVILKLQNDEYFVGGVRWSEAVCLTYKFPVHRFLPPGIREAILYTGTGISENAERTWNELISSTHPGVLRRLVTYLESSRTQIELFKISRDGSGVEYAVTPEDTGVHHLLCAICVLYPAALVKQDTKFLVKNGPLLWSLRDKLIERSRLTVITRGVWNIPRQDTRLMWEHQKDIVQTMQERHVAGKRGSLLWVPVGMGKSMCVTQFITGLIATENMPSYCVWTMPPSAVDSVGREITTAGLPYQILDMRSNGKNQKLLPGLVNVIFHDHLRLGDMRAQLEAVAQDMYFVVDEFHKTMAHTIRTSITLDIVRLSKIFAGLSGTIVRDNEVNALIPWLEQVVEFEVTEKNYWVAVGALISKKVMTNVVVVRETVEAKLKDPGRYYSLVPKSLGGTANNLNFREAVNECHVAITESLVELTMNYVNVGEPVFLVAKNKTHQLQLNTELLNKGVKHIHLIDSNNPITLAADSPSVIQVVITTITHSTGYTLTKMGVGITGVYFSNEATREQIEGRINRIGQTRKEIKWIIVHAGILTYILKRYEQTRSWAASLKGFATDTGMSKEELQGLREQL